MYSESPSAGIAAPCVSLVERKKMRPMRYVDPSNSKGRTLNLYFALLN